jgi:hypothetical protein
MSEEKPDVITVAPDDPMAVSIDQCGQAFVDYANMRNLNPDQAMCVLMNIAGRVCASHMKQTGQTSEEQTRIAFNRYAAVYKDALLLNLGRLETKQ